MNFFCFITLILCLFKVSKATESVDISGDFKTLLMYFSEAFLKGAVFDGKALEEDNPINVASTLVEAINRVESENTEMPYLGDLVLFKTQLAAGIPIAQNILTSRSDGAYDTMSADAFAVQIHFIEALEQFGGVIMPIGWVGHTLYLVMRKGESEGTLDFAIVNTGDGIKYHHHSADPNGVYPNLSQIWMEFKNVERAEIFPENEDAWFFYGLIALKKEFFKKRLKYIFTPFKEPEYLDYFPEYFYGSFLANFKENLVDPPRGDRLVPMQRSGSCTLSSLIGALLYTSESEETFYLHRLKIGHALIKLFLEKAQVNERFKTIITDGFETNGRNFLKMIASSLAQKTLEYLEFALPEHFRHAGLIGSERYKWIFEKKEAANKELREGNPLVLENVQISIQRINEIMTFLEDNPISLASNDIILPAEIKSEFSPLQVFYLGKIFPDKGKILSNDFFGFLNEKCDRLNQSFLSFGEFYEAIMQFNNLENVKEQTFYRILNVFQRAHELLKDDRWLDSVTELQTLLVLQDICKRIANSFACFKDKFWSFDDIVLLVYLQKFAWKLSVTYDNRLPEGRRIGLGSFAAPRTIQSVLFGFAPVDERRTKVSLLAGYMNRFIIHNCFDQKNAEIFMELMGEDAAEMENGKPTFMGPESFCTVDERGFYPSLRLIRVEGEVKEKNIELYEKMMGHPEVDEILKDLRNDERPKNLWKAFNSDYYGKFIIVFSKGRSRLFQHFQHYYNLMDTLAFIRVGPVGEVSSKSGSSWTEADIKDIEKEPLVVVQSYATNLTNIKYFGNSYNELLGMKHELFWKNRLSNYRSLGNLFYIARHSLALTEFIDVTSLETWLNYIKGSSSAKLFDCTYFQYISDHLLNVPKFETPHKLMFPVDALIARSIIKELARLVSISLETIKIRNQKFSTEKKKLLIRRAVNVSVILTRFISRIESMKILSGSECAKSLARIYNLLIPLASFKTDYLLTDQEISFINLALGHICTVSIRNALTFMNNVDLSTAHKGLRMTLRRYHWFAAKKNYISSEFGTNIADDQFNYGTSGSPMTPEETGFLKELLLAYFLPGLMPSKLTSADFLFSYNYELYLVKIQNPAKGLEIFINLWTGAAVFNGMRMININNFINLKEFLNFFALEDRPLVSNGIAAEAAGVSIYAVPDFKGSSYMITIEVKHIPCASKDITEIKINRKWNGNWYTLTNFEDITHSFQGISLEYNWIENDSWIFKREFGRSLEMIVIMKNDMQNPVMRFLGDVNSIVQIAVDGLCEDSGSGWTALFRLTPRSQPLLVYLFQRNIESFTRGAYILTKDEFGHFVVICMNLRFAEDMRRPIVFREKRIEGTSEIIFEILNLPNTEICPNQSLGGGSSLSGGLLIISDSKKALLLPNALKSEDTKKTSVQVEKIPISDDNLAPQTREHKLLLSYYLILQFEFNSARKLLSPSSSIHHNEAFSAKEINILQWITAIDLEAPEALALKLFAYLHSEFNRKKFSFDYFRNSLPEISAPGTLSYLYALREMSEKYYIFLIFPEVMEETLFSKLFEESLKNNFNLPKPDIKYELYNRFHIYHEKTFYTQPHSYKIGERLEDLIVKLIHDGKQGQLKLASRLIVRRNHKKHFYLDSEMAAICYAKRPDLWTEFENVVLTLKVTEDTKKREQIAYQSTFFYHEAMQTCIPNYKHLFEGMDQSSGITMTSLETLKATFEVESSRLRLNVVNQNPIQEPLPELVSAIDLGTISAAEAKLRAHLNLGNANSISFGFNAETMKKSNVLKKLQKSIDDFVKETAQRSQSEINFGDDVSTLKDLKTFFSARINDLSSAQVTDITELGTNLNADTCSSAIGSILSLMHQKKAKTFESLYACYLRDSLVCIQKKFPQLTLEQCMEVQEKAKIFYSRQVLINYFEALWERTESFLDSDKNNIPVSADELNIFCDELTKIKDFNERMKDPVIMNFEFRSGKYRLKHEQVEDVGLLTSADEDTKLFPSVVIQRMMAAGKTLVLGTISVVKKALNGKQLSILVPPSSLYQSNTTAMQARTYQYFKKNGINFTFPRFEMPSKKNPESMNILASYLETVLKLITSTMNDNNYMILSPDTLHSYLNSYIEALLNAESNWNEGFLGILNSYAQIYRIFKQQGSIILDEIDMTMDPKKELNFPTQEMEPYNMIAVALLADIMEFMVFDENIQKAGLHIHSNNQASLTAKNYEICVQLVLKYIESQLANPSSLWYHLVFGSNSDVATVNDVIEFLADPNMAGSTQCIDKFYGANSQVLADALIVVKNQLHYHLEHAFKGTVNQNFGSARSLRPGIKFAVPYVAANTPSALSVFADRWETMLKSLLMVSASPCSLEIAKEIIEFARNTIISESAVLESLEETVTYQNLKLILPADLCPMALDSKNILHNQIVQEALSARSPAAIRLLFTFYITQVFDKMTFPIEQITSNALDVTSMFNSVQGYSGTIDNVNILPQHVVKAAYEDNLKNEKYNGGISLKLVRDCDDGVVEELNEEAFTKSAEDMVKDLMSLYPSDNVSAIIDTGAFFKNFKNIQVARAILSTFTEFEAALYYDEDSNQLKYLRVSNDTYTDGILETSEPEYIGRKTEVELGKRFTFYDQRHITGSDILQPKTAHAIMTIGPRVLLRDILQGALRMRQFMTSQRVHLVTTKASRKFYESKIKNDEKSRKIESMTGHKIEEVKLQNDELVEGIADTEELVESKELAEAKEQVEEAISERDTVETAAIEMKETTMTVSDVLTLGALNEDDKQEHENVKLAFGKINSEIRAFILDEISRALVKSSDESTREYVLGMVECGRALFLRSIKEVPQNWLQESKQENTTDVLRIFAIFRLHSLTKVMKRFESNLGLQQRFNSMKKRIKYMISPANEKYYYAKKTICTSIKLDEGTEVQQQTLTLTMVDMNMDTLMKHSFLHTRKEYVHDYNLLANLKLYESNESLETTLDDYFSLKDLYIEKYSNESHKSYLVNTLVTLGDRVGVTQDLVILVEKPLNLAKYRYPILTESTFEGSHILVQLYGSNVKVLLISSKHAKTVFKALDPSSGNDFNPSKFWLCDLSGSVTATNDPETERGQNILDFIPKIDNLMFDLLAFNGSLPQILGNPKLKAIYDHWLKSEFFEKRAIFLRLRMKALMDKDKEMFEIDDENLGILKSYSSGVQNIKESVGDGYPKGAVEGTFQVEKMTTLNIASTSQQPLVLSQTNPINFDLSSEIRQLLNIIGYNESTTTTPVFLAGSEEITAQDVNIEEETSAVTITERTLIPVSITYPMASKMVNENVEEEEQVGEVLEDDIQINESMDEYQEPALTEDPAEDGEEAAKID